MSDPTYEELKREVEDFHNANFASMSRINRAERVAENAVIDKQAAEVELRAFRAEVEDVLTAVSDFDYYCPTVGSSMNSVMLGFSPCCNYPELHLPDRR